MAARESLVKLPRHTFLGAVPHRVPVVWLQYALIVATLVVLPFGLPVDPDYWWHLRTGELILDGGIPSRDPFSWTRANEPWVAHEWLSEAFIAGVDRSFGHAGNLVLFGGVAAGTLALMYASGRIWRGSGRAMVGLVFLASLYLIQFVTPRPQLFSWLLFAVFFYILSRREAGSRAPVWGLPGLMLIWANLHMGFVFGLALLACWCVSAISARLRGEARSVLEPLLVGAASVAATLVNPVGYELLLYPLRYLEDRESLTVIAEWRRPNFMQPFLFPYTLSCVLLVVALARRSRPRFFVCLVTGMVLVLSVQALRNVPYVALMLVPVGATLFQSAAAKGRETTVHAAAAVALIGTFIVLLASIAVSQSGGWSEVREPREKNFPAGGVEFVERELPDARLYNEYTWGGYIVYSSDIRVFVDGRTDFYRADLLDDYSAIGRVEPNWDALLDVYGVNTLLLRKNATLSQAVADDPRWREAYRGDVEVVFVRVR